MSVHLAERDGCGCPHFVVRCVHHPDGTILWLCDWELDPPYWSRYHVCTNHWADENDCPGFVDTTHDYAAALAAFHEAEQRLIAGAL